MTSEDLADVLGTVETAALEFKVNAKSARTQEKIGQAICAMANDLTNMGGGDILVGVDDDGEPAEGVDTSDEALRALIDYRDDGRILDRPNLTVAVARYKGTQVVRLHVQASAAPPVRFNNVVFVRPGPTTRKAHADDERILTERRRANHLPFDLHARPPASQEDLNLKLFQSDYLPSAVSREVIEENGRPLAQQLASLHMIDPNGTPTVLGLLVIGFDSRPYIPGSYVQFVRYAGTDKSAEVADDRELGGNIVTVAQALDAVLGANLRVAIEQSDSIFTEGRHSEYPRTAIRESVMNALMHRDYQVSNAPVQIDWFDDRVQISNPGGPYGRVTTTNFDTVNDYRNPSLAAAMKHLGLVNRFGRGITRIKGSMADNGNPDPEFIVNEAQWAVILRSAK